MNTNITPRPDDARTGREPAAAKHLLPPLPYEYAALEPTIDARTMMLHHDEHHASYVEKLNAALEKFPALRKPTRGLSPFLVGDGKLGRSCPAIRKFRSCGAE